MNEEEAFRHAILNDPDDDVHRLIFADWLLENDPAREAFVRQQGLLGPSVRTTCGLKLVPIPAGEFQMGSPPTEISRDPDEAAHPVRLRSAFYLGDTPVTVGQYRAFVEATGHIRVGGALWHSQGRYWTYEYEASWRNPGWTQADDHPVVNLRHEDALAFCHWLGEIDGRDYRLPTEAEWEYACRAGTTTRYHFGEGISPANANFDTAGFSDVGIPPNTGTAPVRSYPPNEFGLYDMHGNVWEWVSDWYDFFTSKRQVDPHGPEAGLGRVLRGGSWCDGPEHCRSAQRRCGNPDYSRYRDGNTGFRVALSMPRRGG